MPICFKLEKNSAILETKYYIEISKIIEIITYINIENEKKKGKPVNFFETGKLNSSVYNNKNSNHDSNLVSSIKKENYKNIFDKLILFYFCFSFESSDNSLLVLSFYILNELIKLPLDYGHLLFKLFHLCILNIASIDFMLTDGKNIIKNLYKFIKKLIVTNEENTPVCVLYFLKILEIISYKIKNFHSDFIYTIQKYIILLHNDYQLSYKYFELAMNDKKDKIEFSHISSSEESSSSKQKNFSTILSKNIKIDMDSTKDLITKNQFNENNIIKNSFNIYIKLLNDVFDFSINRERRKVKNIIDINQVIYLLKYNKLSINIRTEFLKFSRKMLIDLIYSEDSTDSYTKTIINDEDNLISLKNNPLTNNSQYPTKYLSFMQDFYNISAKESLNEKQDFYKSLKLMKQFQTENIQNKFRRASVVSKNSSLLSYDDIQTPANNISLNNSTFYTNLLNDSYINIKNLDKENNIKNNSDKKKEKENTEKCYSPKNTRKLINRTLNSQKTKNSSNNLELFPIVEDESSKELDITKNNISNDMTKVNEIERDNSSNSELENNEINKTFNTKNEEIQNESICKKKLNKSLNVPKISKNNFHFPSGSFIENDLDSKNEINFLPCFDELFYEILKNELENLTNHVYDEYPFIMEDDEIAKESLRNYFENGLLIPIIYYFKKSFSLIHNFSGEEMIKFYYLVEQSINLKLYISKFSSNLWEEEEKVNEFTEETTRTNKNDFILK